MDAGFVLLLILIGIWFVLSMVAASIAKGGESKSKESS